MLNDSYFETIDCEEKAYFIGYLLADGCITKSNGVYNQVQLHLAYKDYEIVEKLHEVTSCDNKIYVNPTYTRCMFRSISSKMVNDLAKYGITPNKTGQENPEFETIPNELIHHTIRGLIDGDGWICISDTLYGTKTSVGICGSYDTCHFVTEKLHEEIGVKSLKVSKVKNKNCYKIAYSSLKDDKSIIKYLYADATIYLSRKYDKANEILSMWG